MENVLLGVAVALFVIGVALGVVAAVMFVKRDIMNSIRFLQGKRISADDESKKKRARRGSAAGAGRPRAASSAVARDTTENVGDDRTTGFAGSERADDNLTTVVSTGADRADDRPTTIAGMPVDSVDFITSDEGIDGSETPTEVLSELDEESERATGVLEDTDAEDSEHPTGVLTEHDEEDSEHPTSALVAEPEEDSEAPTTVLGVETDEDSEAPTTVLGATDEAEDSEAPTTVLGAAEAEEESDEESERATAVLGESLEDSERATDVLVSPHADAENVTDDDSGAQQGVVQQEEPLFRFILKQNVIVVHTEETLD